MRQKELEEIFKTSYLRGVGTAIFSVYGKVMWWEDLNLKTNTLKISVYDKCMEELEGVRDLDKHLKYKKEFKLSNDIFESKVNVSMNLDNIITTVQSDLIYQN